MKRVIYWIIAVISAACGFIFGFLYRQPKINKLKKQIELLQQDNRKLIEMITDKQRNYQELLVRHKALKALQFRKKSALKEEMTENLILQYAIKAYLTLLLKSGRYEKKLEINEIRFYKAFDKFIEGGKVSVSDNAAIRDYVMENYRYEIKHLKECEYVSVLSELRN